MAQLNWYRGSLHVHTINSDGDTPPEAVAAWYKRNGYDFIAFTDHHKVTRLEGAALLVVHGEEVSARINNGETAIHINALGIERDLPPVELADALSTLQANVDAIVKAGGIASVNHPNYTWAFDHTALARLNGATLMEVHNAHPVVNTYGGGGKPGAEAIWDGVLTAGRRIFGIATDDAHHFQGDFSPKRGNPGRAWVVVRAPELTQAAVLAALRAGDFYASTGVTLAELAQDRRSLALRVEQERDFVYDVEFIGAGGTVLQRTAGTTAEYHPKSDERYVRATVRSSAGQRAWTQPVF